MKALVIAAVTLAWSVRVAAAVCNTEDGNISDPDHAGINYELVLDGKVEVCDQSAEMPTVILDFARQGWNAVPNINFFQAQCLPPPYTIGVIVQDVVQGWCGGNVACANTPSNVQVRQFLHVYVAPSFAGLLEGEKKHVAGHELGHTLGFWHNVTCPAIMGPCDSESNQSPQAFDIANYYAAYGVEGATSLVGASHAGEQVNLLWQPYNFEGEELCNEAGFRILNGTLAGITDHPINSIELDGQAQGVQNYRVQSHTHALPALQGESDINVNVLPASAIGCDELDNDHDGAVTMIGDVLLYRGRLAEECAFGPPSCRELDTDGDGVLTMFSDVLAYRGRIGEVC